MIRRIALFAGLLVALMPGLSAAQSLFGSEYGGFAIYQIDPTIGTFVTLGATGSTTGEFPGLAYSPLTGKLYGTDEQSLYTVNQTTGAATLVGSHGVAGEGLTSLSFDPTYSVMYSIGYDGYLYSVNPTTGAATQIGALGASPNRILALATDSSGNTYGVGTDNILFSVNTTTGAATSLGSISGTTSDGGLTSIVFDNSDVLYGIDTSSDRLVILDPATRVVTYVSASGIGSDVRGLAYVTPAVPTLPTVPLLALLGLVILAGAAVLRYTGLRAASRRP